MGNAVRMQLRGLGRVVAAVSFGLLVMVGWQATTSAAPNQDYPGDYCGTPTTDYYGGTGTTDYYGGAVPMAHRVGAQDYPGYEGCPSTTTGPPVTGTSTASTVVPPDTVFPSDTSPAGGGTSGTSGDPLARTGPPAFLLPVAVAAALIALVLGSGALLRARSARS